jgi:DNA topoisomerase-1
VKEDRPGTTRNFHIFTLKNNNVSETIGQDKTGQVKNKLVPTDIGNIVTQFLLRYFVNVMDYNFTAKVEKEFDEIALGQKVWNTMIDEFYKPFHKRVKVTIEKSEKFSGEKLLGQEPATGNNVFVKIGRFGPMVQIGDTESEEKPRFAALKKGQTLDNITLQDALDLFKFPRTIGNYEDEEMVVSIGRFGPYVRHKSKFYSLGKEDDPLTVEDERAIAIIEEKRKKDREKIIKMFDENEDVQVLNGRWGPYISIGKKNYKIPKGTEPASLSLDDCLKIAKAADKNPTKTRRFKKSK